MNRSGLVAIGDAASRIILVGVLAVALAVEIFRPSGAIRRDLKRAL